MLAELLRSARVSQWSKNALLFVPVLAAHRWSDWDRLVAVAVAFASLCLLASGTYLVNDLLDLEADRAHPRKRERPLAAGTLSQPLAKGAAAALIGAGLGLSAFLSNADTTLMLVAYLIVSLTYSTFLKRRLMIDVIALAGLFCHRILLGGVAAEVSISPWLLAFSLFIFLSLALVKRYLELDLAREADRVELARRAYTVQDTETVFMMGLVSAYLSILVLCLYVSSGAVTQLYSNPQFLWALCLIMLYWVSRIWLLARRGELGDDPTAFATKDPISYVCAILLGAVVLVAR